MCPKPASTSRAPPLVWADLPADTVSLALIVEDPDAPALKPFVHALVWNMPADTQFLSDGAIAADESGDADGKDVRRNSYMVEGWLPPDPPKGHGTHDYVFQLFALAKTPVLGSNPGRSDFIEAIRGCILAGGLLVGTYSRDEPQVVATEVIVGRATPG